MPPEAPADQHGVPGLRPVPAHDRAAEHRLRPASCRTLPAAEIDERVARSSRWCGIEELADRAAGAAFRRPAAARGARPRARHAAAGAAAGRAASRARSQAPQAMQEELRRIHQPIGGTFVFVTHDQGEAMGLANRIAVMDDGAHRAEGHAARRSIARPRAASSPTFIGEANMLAGRRRQGYVAARGRSELSCRRPRPARDRDGPPAPAAHRRDRRSRRSAVRRPAQRHRVPRPLRALPGRARERQPRSLSTRSPIGEGRPLSRGPCSPLPSQSRTIQVLARDDPAN